MCSLLIAQSLPAERARGLIFCERFYSVDAFYKNGGTVTAGSPTFSQNSVYMNGSSYITYSIGNLSIRGNGAFTILATTTPIAVSALSVIVGFGTSALTNGPYIGVNSLSGASNVWAGNYGGAIKGTFVFDGRPHQICMVSSGAALGSLTPVALYVDGTLLNSATSFTISVSSSTVFMGDHGGGYPYNGIINNVRLFNVALTPEEVLAYAKVG